MKLLGAGLALAGIMFLFWAADAQQPTPSDPQKANSRPAPTPTPAKVKPEPYDGASAERMNAQCVTLETAEGNILIELFADAAPETVRNFLNLSATGFYDGTVFNRVVKGFVVQGGNVKGHDTLTQALVDRSRRTIPDEPSFVKHERGIVSMARPDRPNGATTDFFILVVEAPTLDGTFAAFGRVRTGMDIVDHINQEDVNEDKPVKPVRVNRAVVTACPATPSPAPTP